MASLLAECQAYPDSSAAREAVEAYVAALDQAWIRWTSARQAAAHPSIGGGRNRMILKDSAAWGGAFNITGGQLSNSGTLTQTGGELNVTAGALLNSGMLTIAETSAFTGTVSNSGTVYWESGEAGWASIDNQGTLVLEDGGTLDDNYVVGGATLEVAGGMLDVGSHSLTIGNGATVMIDSGSSLTVGDGGQLTIDAGELDNLNGGTVYWEPGEAGWASINNQGTINVDASDVDLSNLTLYRGTYQFNNGAYVTEGTSFVFSGYSLSGPITNNGTLYLANSALSELSQFTNNGTVVFANGVDLSGLRLAGGTYVIDLGRSALNEGGLVLDNATLVVKGELDWSSHLLRLQ